MSWKQPVWLGALLAWVAVTALAAGQQADRADQTDGAATELRLETVFDRGAVFQDRNGDEVTDFVSARFVLGEPPTASDVAAAANVAARFGFESMALDLPLADAAPDATGMTIVAIGAAGVARAGLAAEVVGLDRLASGEGLVTVAEIDGRAVIVVAGADEAGTSAAAELLAGRLPNVWDPKAATLAEVVAAVTEFLEEERAAPERVEIVEATVDPDADAIARLTIAVRFASADGLRRAEMALNELAGQRQRADPDAGNVGDAGDDPPALSYPGAREFQIDLRTGDAASVSVRLPRAAGPDPKPRGSRPGSAAKRSLDLSSVYANDGFLGDANSDLIPDRTDILLVPAGDGVVRMIDLAARIGLETTGLSTPLALPAEAIENPESLPTLVLVGVDHPLVGELVDDGKFTRPDLAPGQGLIQVVRPAFGSKSAVVVTGGDTAGLDRALQQLAERFPHVWERGKDRTTIDVVEDDLRRLISARSPAGQAATALYKIEQMAAELAELDLEAAEVTVYVDKPARGLDAIVRAVAEDALSVPRLAVSVESLDVREAKPISVNGAPIGAEIEFPSEVDEFWRRFRSEVVSAVLWDEPIVVTARLSEPPMLRARIQQQAVQELVDAGGHPVGGVGVGPVGLQAGLQLAL